MTTNNDALEAHADKLTDQLRSSLPGCTDAEKEHNITDVLLSFAYLSLGVTISVALGYFGIAITLTIFNSIAASLGLIFATVIAGVYAYNHLKASLWVGSFVTQTLTMPTITKDTLKNWAASFRGNPVTQ